MGIKEVECEGVEFAKLSRNIQYIDQQMHLIKDNIIQTIQTILWSASPLRVSAPHRLLKGLYVHKAKKTSTTPGINLPGVISA
jgi:hypothetical protein